MNKCEQILSHLGPLLLTPFPPCQTVNDKLSRRFHQLNQTFFDFYTATSSTAVSSKLSPDGCKTAPSSPGFTNQQNLKPKTPNTQY